MLYDKDIREALFNFLEEKYGKVRVIEEKNMGNSRADIVAVTDDGVMGIEIKSDADSYARLSGQVKDYDRFFDYNCIVVGSTHASKVSEHVPSYWGIISVEEIDGCVDFYTIREPEDNPKMIITDKLSLLWRPELAHLQEINGMFKYKEKSKSFVIEKISDKISTNTLRKLVCEELFERDYTLIEGIIAEHKKIIDNGKKRKKKRQKRYKI